jgi:hypothetical protein
MAIHVQPDVLPRSLPIIEALRWTRFSSLCVSQWGDVHADADAAGADHGHPGQVICLSRNTPWGYRVQRVMSAQTTWSAAISATLHCLTGCAIGEVLGMVLATWWDWGDVASIALAVVLAFFFGYLLTYSSVRRHGASHREAVRLALASDTISITSMEIIDNVLMLAIPGAMTAGLASATFWLSLAISLVIAFVVTVPVNRWLISRGRGHAAIHQLHSHH